MIEKEIEIRLAKPDDLNFIFSCWLRNYRHSSQFAKKISNTVYYKWHHKVIERIIGRGAQVRIAHPIGEPDVILGFSCLEALNNDVILHFIYVKKPFRGLGIAKALVWEKENVQFTHLTENLDLEKYPLFTYNPYLI